MISGCDDIQRALIGGGYESPAGLSFAEKFLFCDFIGLGVMCDEYDLHVAVFGADKPAEKEEKASRKILLHRVH